MSHQQQQTSLSKLELKTLNRLAHQLNQFGSLYIVPARVTSCPPSSDCLRRPQQASKPKRLPSAHTELNRLASFVTQFGFVYPETRIPATKPDFLKTITVRKETGTEDLACLKELNRLARLVELTSKSTKDCPVYPVYQPLAYQVHDYRYGKGLSSPVASKLRDHLKLSASNNFVDAFPATTKPRLISMTLGSPRYNKEDFNRLLTLKLDQARAYFKLNHTPSCYPRLVTSWIISLLVNLKSRKEETRLRAKMEKQQAKALHKARNNIAFVSSSEALNAKETPAPPQTSCDTPISLETSDIESPSPDRFDVTDLRIPIQKWLARSTLGLQSEFEDLTPLLRWLEAPILQLSPELSSASLLPRKVDIQITDIPRWPYSTSPPTQQISISDSDYTVPALQYLARTLLPLLSPMSNL
jgi:hypothetical protein